MVVRFDDNACALIGKNGEPLGTRINGESDDFCMYKNLKDCTCIVSGVGICVFVDRDTDGWNRRRRLRAS